MRPCRPSLLLVALLSGCAARVQPLYYWGAYEDSIHARYSDHDTAKAEEQLRTVIQGAEGGRGRVPPGVYADYGLLLYQRGNGPGAVEYFQKEAQAFPESSALMQKLIARVSGRGGAPEGKAASPDSSPPPSPGSGDERQGGAGGPTAQRSRGIGAADDALATGTNEQPEAGAATVGAETAPEGI